MDISVVILSWNDFSYLEECLESLNGSAGTRSIEVIVVDNASTDGTPDRAEAKFPHVKFIRNSTNLGFPRGNNVGIAAATGKYVCLLNSDIKVLGNCLEKLVAYMDQHQDIGMIGPRILNADGTHQSSCRRFPSLWNNFCSATGLARIFQDSKMFSGEHMLFFKGDRLLDVDVLVGCFWLVRREALQQFGVLDEGFFMYAEDVDWCKRCWDSGWRVVFYPDAESIHYRGGSSTKKDPVWLAVTQQRSVLRYWKKHHGNSGVLGMSAIIFVHKMIRWAASLLSFLIKPSGRCSSTERMGVARACLADLFLHRNEEKPTGVKADGGHSFPCMMSPQDAIRRFLSYAKRHGVRGTWQRLKISFKRFRTGNEFVLFSCDLKNIDSALTKNVSDSCVKRISRLSDFSPRDLEKILNLWNPEIARRQMEERFTQGANLWIFKLEGKVAAYGWTLVGTTMEPHFFLLQRDDVHLFDFFVLPAFRGRKINVALMNHILSAMASEQHKRALIEAAAWNSPQLSSLKKSPFKRIGRARKASLFRRKQLVIDNER